MYRILVLSVFFLTLLTTYAQKSSNDSVTFKEQMLDEVQINRNKVSIKRMSGAQMGFDVNKDELFKAACCNLGESFQNNPSVDVNYSDAATGAKQIKLLGLSGSYVQMLTETQPNFFGAAKPFSLGYVPGPWMKAISVSKGASSVKGGYEGIAGQINVQYLSPEDPEGVSINMYGDNDSRFEFNADANKHINENLSTEILAHYDENWGGHDNNGDSFMDKPNVRQFNLQNRWLLETDKYIFHGGISGLKENRTFGQTMHSSNMESPWVGTTDTERYEAYMKHAFFLNKEHGSNIAFLSNFAVHNQDNAYGNRLLDVKEKDLTAQMIYETNISHLHNISVGANYEQHWLNQSSLFGGDEIADKNKGYGSIGAYGQYTFNLHNRFIAMAGLRADVATAKTNENRLFLTPRLHLKYQITDWMQLRASAGKGYRFIQQFWAENNNLLAMGREIKETLSKREDAWNFGGTLGFDIPLWNKNLKLNAEYFYTTFRNQAVVDYDTDVNSLLIYDLNDPINGGKGKSYSHVLQIDATYEPLHGLTTTLAFRRNIVKTTYDGILMDKALSSKYKGLFSFSYKPGMGLWQFDGSLQLNGPVRIPKSVVSDGTHYSSSYPQLSLQVTRWFRNFSVYVGGENLTNYKQQNPIIGADGPFSTAFDATQVWAPIHGRMLYAGLRVNLGRL